jgi:hypothetical protein
MEGVTQELEIIKASIQRIKTLIESASNRDPMREDILSVLGQWIANGNGPYLGVVVDANVTFLFALNSFGKIVSQYWNRVRSSHEFFTSSIEIDSHIKLVFGMLLGIHPSAFNTFVQVKDQHGFLFTKDDVWEYFDKTYRNLSSEVRTGVNETEHNSMVANVIAMYSTCYDKEDITPLEGKLIDYICINFEPLAKFHGFAQFRRDNVMLFSGYVDQKKRLHALKRDAYLAYKRKVEKLNTV